MNIIPPAVPYHVQDLYSLIIKQLLHDQHLEAARAVIAANQVEPQKLDNTGSNELQQLVIAGRESSRKKRGGKAHRLVEAIKRGEITPEHAAAIAASTNVQLPPHICPPDPNIVQVASHTEDQGAHFVADGVPPPFIFVREEWAGKTPKSWLMDWVQRFANGQIPTWEHVSIPGPLIESPPPQPGADGLIGPQEPPKPSLQHAVKITFPASLGVPPMTTDRFYPTAKDAEHCISMSALAKFNEIPPEVIAQHPEFVPPADALPKRVKIPKEPRDGEEGRRGRGERGERRGRGDRGDRGDRFDRGDGERRERRYKVERGSDRNRPYPANNYNPNFLQPVMPLFQTPMLGNAFLPSTLPMPAVDPSLYYNTGAAAGGAASNTLFPAYYNPNPQQHFPGVGAAGAQPLLPNPAAGGTVHGGPGAHNYNQQQQQQYPKYY